MLTLYAILFPTSYNHNKDSISWDMDSIPFVIDHSTTAIIISQSRIFKRPLLPVLVTPETAEGLTTTTKLIGSMTLILTDDANKHHSYVIPCCVFDPKTPVNTLGVPALVKFFGDNVYATCPLAEGGTTIK